MSSELNYASHRAYDPKFHFVAVPILGINILVRLVLAIMHPTLWIAWWDLLVAFALGLVAWVVRAYPARVQDRVIRTEELLRLERVLPADLRPRIGELSSGDLIGLRFAPDDEIPDLVRAILAGECKGREAIKQRIKGSWRADKMRI